MKKRKNRVRRKNGAKDISRTEYYIWIGRHSNYPIIGRSETKLRNIHQKQLLQFVSLLLSFHANSSLPPHPHQRQSNHESETSTQTATEWHVCSSVAHESITSNARARTNISENGTREIAIVAYSTVVNDNALWTWQIDFLSLQIINRLSVPLSWDTRYTTHHTTYTIQQHEHVAICRM